MVGSVEVLGTEMAAGDRVMVIGVPLSVFGAV